MADDDLCYRTLTEVAELVRTREISPVELTRASLDRIGRVDGRLHGYLSVLSERALERAAACEREITDGVHRGPLHGVPVAVKDLCDLRGSSTTCASKVLPEEPAAEDATVVARLEAAGAVILGKLNMTEFAYAGYHPELPAPVNAWGENRFPGLSSSGSGAATAAGLCYASLGTDTGGSIRFPAAANGVVGIKPTYGRVSRAGVFPLSHTLDHVGPLARSVADAAVVLSAIAGHDGRDPTSLAVPLPDLVAAAGGDLAGVRVGIDESYCTAGVDTEVAAAVAAVGTTLADLGASLREVTLPPLEQLFGPWFAICGVDALVAHGDSFPARSDRYGPLMREFLESALAVPATEYAGALVACDWLRRAFETVFTDIDVLLCPALASPPAKVGDRSSDVEHVMGSAFFSVPYNLTGSPTVTFPCGFSGEGVPLAAQLVGRPLDEQGLCRVAGAYEAATEWHTRHPRLV